VALLIGLRAKVGVNLADTALDDEISASPVTWSG